MNCLPTLEFMKNKYWMACVDLTFVLDQFFLPLTFSFHKGEWT